MPLPSLDQRLAVCAEPHDQPQVMHQEWRELGFLHWEWEAAELSATLPPGLHLDLFEGKAYLGVVPFLMRGVRPVYCPQVGPLSNFLELNLRTYVYDDTGRPGVWFYSLEANQQLAVGIARRLFALPYQHAIMQAQKGPDGWIDYTSRRAWTQVETRLRYRPVGQPQASPPDSLEFFLAERYLLFTQVAQKLWSGRVHHPPYPLCPAQVDQWDERLLMLNGFSPSGRPPDLAHYAEGVTVKVYPLRPNPSLSIGDVESGSDARRPRPAR